MTDSFSQKRLHIYIYSRSNEEHGWSMVLLTQATVKALEQLRKLTLAEAVAEVDRGQLEERWENNVFSFGNKNLKSTLTNWPIYEEVLIVFQKVKITSLLLFSSEKDAMLMAIQNEMESRGLIHWMCQGQFNVIISIAIFCIFINKINKGFTNQKLCLKASLSSLG